ncbi:MAG TPA: hypothetical protein DCP36_15585, partial [Sporomusaceae bacterium]|nr:hypothetical protein [Sporomusaceae bacterium]
MHEVRKIRKPIYAAAGLLLLSAGLTFAVVSALSQSIRPLPPLADKQQLTEQRLQVEQPAVSAPALPEAAASLPVPPVKQSASVPKVGQAVEQPLTPSTPAVEAALVQDTRRQPLNGAIVADFGWLHHAVYQDWRFHTGIDIAGTPGQPVRAAASGRIVNVMTDNQLGLMLVMESG